LRNRAGFPLRIILIPEHPHTTIEPALATATVLFEALSGGEYICVKFALLKTCDIISSLSCTGG
ncbi:MAG: hypothetical protein RMH93_02230, partial [Aquificaceae bacterium]|nr:hypothetical protein [Aquificaceae bacterium]